MGRGSRGRGRGSVGDHPEDEEDFYEEEMEVSSPPVPGEVGGWWALLGETLETVEGKHRVAVLCVSTFVSYFGIEETFTWFKIGRVPKL